MNDIPLDDLLSKLQESDCEKLSAAIGEVSRRLSGMDEADLRRAVEALSGLFYIDLFDRADLMPAVEEAEAALVGAGEKVIPILIRMMEGSDFKAHFHLARILGKIGVPSLPHLTRLSATADDPYTRCFAMYAIGKVKSPEVHTALAEVTGGMMHPDKEVRDTAARTLGKIAEVVEPEQLSERRRTEMFQILLRATYDVQAPVRAKAVRSLGKMARRGYLEEGQLTELGDRLESMLTRGGAADWDHAYVVRREAQEALGYLENAVKARGGG